MARNGRLSEMGSCCVSILHRIAKLDLTLQSNKKQMLFKMLFMRRSANDKAGTVSEQENEALITNIDFISVVVTKCYKESVH